MFAHLGTSDVVTAVMMADLVEGVRVVAEHQQNTGSQRPKSLGHSQVCCTLTRMAVWRRSAQAQSVRARVLHNRAPCAYVPSGDMIGSIVVHHTVAFTAMKALRTIEFILSQRRFL